VLLASLLPCGPTLYCTLKSREDCSLGSITQKLMLDATRLRNKQEIDQRGLLEQEAHTTERAVEDFVKGAVKSVRW
jgi:hypothetical protein